MPRLHQRPVMLATAAATLAGYVRLVDRTGRFELKADPSAAELVRRRRPFIGAFWHGRMMMIQPAWRRLLQRTGVERPLWPCVIGSDHADGILVGEVMLRLGLDFLPGSNKRGGLAIFRNALRILDAGRIVVITPDGPRGPAEVAKPGIARLAQKAGVPIVPISFAANRVRRLRSWDSFVVALPFARGVMAFGEPISIARDDDPERARLDVGRAISRLSEGVDRDLLSDAVPAAPA